MAPERVKAHLWEKYMVRETSWLTLMITVVDWALVLPTAESALGCLVSVWRTKWVGSKTDTLIHKPLNSA